MTRTRRILALAAGGLLLSTAPAGAEVLASPARATPVDADAGLVVWSEHSAEGYRLEVARPPAISRTLAVPPQPLPFDADLGTDAEGRKMLAYTACPGDRSTCDVHVLRLADGHDEVLAAAARPGVDEHAPTISRGRVAWAVGGQGPGAPGPRVRSTVKLATLGSAAPPVTLPGLPKRRCAEYPGAGRRCEAVSGYISELELDGRRLAQAAISGISFERDRELRLVDVARRTSRRLLRVGVGESGQDLIGLSFDRGDRDRCR